MHYYDATGNPSADGDFEMRNGSLVLRNGRTIRFNHMLADSPSGTFLNDAKAAEPPKSIDEALRQTFASMAEAQHTTVAQMLASMEHKKIEETAAAVAAQFVSAQAGHGVAKQFATDGASPLDAEVNYRLTAARAMHDMTQAHKAVELRTPFSADAAASVVAKIVAATIASSQVADAASEAERARSEYRGALAATRHLTANAWRR